MGGTFSTGGRGAHGDFTGVGGPGGFATRVGFSAAPFNIRPVLPDPNPLGLTVGEADCAGGAGDLGFIGSATFVSFGIETGVGAGEAAGVETSSA